MKPATTDVLKHLAESLHEQWRRYCKRLKRCQKKFSEEAVHDARVEIRRLLSTLELLGAFISTDDVQKTRRALKCYLRTFNKLRDTQVQLDYVGRMTSKFPAAREFCDWLKKRERRFTRKTRKAIKHIKTKAVGRQIAEFEKEIYRRRKQTPRAVALKTALGEVDETFRSVTQLCRRVQAKNPGTIHRTRIAFKRFRYMIEALSPLLPAVNDEYRRAMRVYQSLMGDIQDVEVLLAALDKFIRREEIKNKAARQLREELVRRRQRLIQVYLNAANRLRKFWPLNKQVTPTSRGYRSKERRRVSPSPLKGERAGVRGENAAKRANAI